MRPTAGFTLMETLIILLLMAILAALATPSLKAFIDRQRLRSALSELQAFYRSARWEAMQGTDPVVFSVQPDASGWTATISTSNASGVTVKRSLAGSRFGNVAAGSVNIQLAANRGIPVAPALYALELSNPACVNASATLTIWPTGRSSVDKSPCPAL